MNTLAVYNEARLGSSRTFELHADRIVVKHGGAFGQRSEMTYPLESLSAEYGKVWLKDQRQMVTFASVICVAFLLFVTVGGIWALEKGLVYFLAPIGMGMISFLVLYRFVRRIEYVVFSNKSGVPLFLIGKVGREKAHHENFVNALANQIRTNSKE